MTVVLAALSVGALLAAGWAIFIGERGRRAASARIDAVTTDLLGKPVAPSVSPDDAVVRLERALAAGDRRELRRHELERYQAALGSITPGVLVVDEDGQVVFHNDAAEWFRDGRHGEAVVGQAIDDLIGTANAGEHTEREVQIYGPPRRKLFVAASPITDDGLSLGVVVLIDDITERDRLDAIRRDFVANISHELRTPIGAMSLLAETLVNETDPEVVASLAGRLGKEAQRLADTVDDLLELSRIEHGSGEEFQPVALQGVVHGAHDRVRSAAHQRDVSIGINLPERDLMVSGDRRQLTSAVYNLLDNGVKYTGTGGGTVSVRGRLVDDQIELVVQDSGIGVPRRDLDRIFERFYRVDRGRSRASGGTGLGLAIVRHVVANHGGRVSVESVEGEGSTFTLVLPALRTSDDQTEPDDPEQPSDDGLPHRPSDDGTTTTR